MINIEKVQVKEKYGWTKPGIIDLFLSDYDEGRFHLGFLNKNCNLLWPVLKEQLLDNNIKVAEKYGVQGASITQCISDSNSFFEIGDFDIVHGLTQQDAIALLTSCNVIVHDYSEGASYPTSDFYTWLKNLNVTPKNLFLHSGGFNFTESDIPNTTVLPCSSTFAMFTILQSDIYNILFDSDRKKEYVSFLKEQRNKNNFKYLSMVYNRKPRHNRLKLLANLHRDGILNNCLWTLAWSWGDQISDWNSAGSVLKHKKLIHDKLYIEDIADKKIYKFFQAVANQLPKNFTELEAKDPSSGTLFFKDWSGLSKWNSVVEVYTERDHPLHLNPQGFLTEKTFRSYLLGMPNLLIAAPGANEELKKLGLPVLNIIDEELKGWQRVDQLANFLLEDFNKNIDISEHTDQILDCFDAFWSVGNLCKIISNSLKELNNFTS